MNLRMERFAEVGSTMDAAKSLIDRGPKSDFIVLADRQTAGRGRIQGRSWEGAPGASLFMTLCLKGEFGGEAFPPRVGLGTLDALSELAPGFPALFSIKWPNDILGLGGEAGRTWRKVGGILCESSKGWFLAGIGLNLKKEAYPESLADSAASLAEVLAPPAGEAPKSPLSTAATESPIGLPEKLAQAIGGAVVRRLGPSPWRDDYMKSMWGMGKRVGFIAGHPERGALKSGIIAGVDEAGRIVLRGEDGELEAFWSGEISSLKAL